MIADLQSLRIDAAQRGKWNIGFFGAGAVFWIAVTVIANVVPLETARILWIVGTFLILPVAVAISRLFGADPFTKGNPLGELVGYAHMSVIAMTFPIVVGVAALRPDALLPVMAIAYCLDFYVMSWAFGSRIFGLHAAARVILVSLIWVLMPEWRLSVLPASVAALYLGTVLALPGLRRRWLHVHSPEAH